MPRIVLCVIAAVALAVSGASGATGSGQARRVITDLGTLGGTTSVAHDINEAGQVVGTSIAGVSGSMGGEGGR